MKDHHINLSQNNLPLEKWRAVPGYEQYYVVSNLGRVKSLDRYIPHPRLGRQFVRGRILSQKIIEHQNIKTGIPSIDLQVALSMEGVTSYHNVRRIVYAAFKDPKLDFSVSGRYVINADGDGYNCEITNLKLVTKKEKSIRAFDRDRVGESYLKTADRSTWTKAYGGASRRKPVCQLTMAGEIVKQYHSITQASQQTGAGEKEIIMVAKGRWKQFNGFKWQYK